MKVLDLIIEDSDIGTLTIKDYFKELLIHLLEEGESFSGKRPFGNSGWEYDLYIPLIKAKLVKGKLDSCGDIEKVDSLEATEVLLDAVRSL